MATIVCQGLQSCLESQVVESRTLRLKLSSPKPHFSQSLELALKPCSSSDYSITKEIIHRHNHNQDGEKFQSFLNPNPEMSGWSFFQVLTHTETESLMEKKEKDNVYVHPLMKRNYPSKLSEKSLELCTENLGCETGSDDILDNMIFSSSEVGNSPTREPQKQKPHQLIIGDKKATSCNNFPPPLTTMSGSDAFQFRPHREDGRLIIKAVKAPQSPPSCFQAERSHGRLRLCFVKDSPASNFDLASSMEDNDVDNYEEDEEIEELEEEVEEEEEMEGEVEVKEEELGTDGNSLEVGGEIGKEEFQRPSRCKEGELDNKGLLNWEPFWVATS